MILAVASGKGGTGKTTVAVNLARICGFSVQLLDCDVEAPNAQLFFVCTGQKEEVVSMPIPQVNSSLCDGCGECSRFCMYHAIASYGSTPLVFAEMCHGCGGCAKVCPKGAIEEVPKRIGVVRTAQAGGMTLVEGRLDVGVAMSPPLIRAVKAQRQDGMPAIIDAPPGTSCPVIAAIRGVDLVVLVTEPTPFGLHDLKLAVSMVRRLRQPFGVVINRVGIGDDQVRNYCSGENIAILSEIPDDRKIAEIYSRGGLIVEALPGYRKLFEKLAESTVNLMDAAAIGKRQFYGVHAGQGDSR